ncbi:galactoside alpha-(1,2)-fucosyltransferase 2-like [Gigantopelta aegis]|uniref:galactoside alpha-(1,2)-fucosyltransferase 2-like n=1 Tax=Gigantopelta aegis TaxID=1735272 RepID=UPI001B88A239|nr:galactoside alpha-(1,2)-fucosyltransferase 2-like [Gigantopelta aegis]
MRVFRQDTNPNIWSVLMRTSNGRRYNSETLRAQVLCADANSSTANTTPSAIAKSPIPTITSLKVTVTSLTHKMTSLTRKMTTLTPTSKSLERTAITMSSLQKDGLSSRKPTPTPCLDPFLSTFRKQQRFICFRVDGGLGNQMFIFASAYGIARYTGRRIVLDKSWPLLKIFKPNGIVVDRCVCNGVHIKIAERNSAFDETLLRLPTVGNYKVGNYLQSWKYFQNVTNEIKAQFTFRKDILKKVSTMLNTVVEEYENRTANSKNPTLVGVHIRRGDIANEKRFIDFGYKVAPKEYIYKAMDYFKNNFTNVIFVFTSDDMNWTKHNINEEDNVFFVEGNSPEVDMCILAHCNHTIMTVGTFSWFAAFLTGGVTVYYKHFASETSVLRKQFSSDYLDYFQPGWIAMESNETIKEH